MEDEEGYVMTVLNNQTKKQLESETLYYIERVGEWQKKLVDAKNDDNTDNLWNQLYIYGKKLQDCQIELLQMNGCLRI